MSAPDPSTPGTTSADPRVRRAWWFPTGGLVAGALLAAVGAALGAGGRLGMVLLLLLTAIGCALGALYAIVTTVVDDLRGRTVSRRRPISAAVLFVAAAMLMAMVAGAGG